MTRKARAEARRPPVFPACRSKTGCAGSPAAALGGRPGGGVSLSRPQDGSARPREWSGCGVSGRFGGSDMGAWNPSYALRAHDILRP